MAAPITPCDSCGSPIPDSDLETGTAITLLGKRYCAGCKTEAIQGVSLDDLGGRPAPARGAAPKAAPPRPAPATRTPPAEAKAPPARPSPATRPPPVEPKPAPPRPAPKAAAAPAPPPPERKPAPPRRPTAAPSATPPSRKSLLIAAAAAVVVIAVAVVVILTRPSPPGPVGGTKGGTPADPPPAVAPQDREAQARDAFAKVDDLARRGGASYDHLLAAIEKAKPVCRGTAWEKKLDDVRIRVVQEKEAEEASRDLAPLLDELRGAVATDPEFKRYAELQTKFQTALEMAGKTASPKMAEIRILQKDYNGKYEKLAEPHYTEIQEAATQLAEERRYDDALRKINTFPQPLRLSRAWVNLEKLKQDIERRRKDAPPKKK